MKTAHTAQFIIPHVVPVDDNTRWFSDNGCVVQKSEAVEVFVDGTLVSSFRPEEVEVRNLTLVGLSKDTRIKKGKLAKAFGISVEMLRLLRKGFEAHGIDGILPAKRGAKGKVTPDLRRNLIELFETYEMNAHQAYIELGEGAGLSYRGVCRVWHAWNEERETNNTGKQERADQLELYDFDEEETAEEVPEHEQAPEPEPEHDETKDWAEVAEENAPRSGRNVRHLGGWLLVAMTHAYGLHSALLDRWNVSKRWKTRLRVAVDAVIIALGICQRCVEGVRRLEGLSSGVLLRARSAPSESWTRRVLKKFVEKTSMFFAHLTMTSNYLSLAAARGKQVMVFYVDNHLRPYTGKHTIRKGWRMQDKRVLPGTVDYYVHDEDGRPVYRLAVPSNDTLTAWLSPVVRLLRAVLGDSQRILVAFDRAGAFPEQLVKLREEGFEFVTYERRPYQKLAKTAFNETFTVDGETYQVHESRLVNLGKGRGRVRRICVLTPEGQQINLLAVSEEKKERLIEVMLGRWVQENGFKHGNERWGINQLDQRKVEPYPPDAVIPNPARRRVDNALRLVKHREGEARNMLARMKPDDPKRAKVESDLAEAVSERENLEALRPQLPKRAPLEETELKGKLVRHLRDYKTLIDTIRIACANAESELASVLAPLLCRPREAKKVLANIFAAPGHVRVNGKSITVTLEPVGNHNEQEAIEQMFQEVNRWKLTLPGDAKCRQLRFRSQLF